MNLTEGYEIMASKVNKPTSVSRARALLVAVCVLGLGGTFGARPAQAAGGVPVGSVTLSPISTVFNTPIGIDYHQPSGKLLLSVNYGLGGIPNNFDLVAGDGSNAPFGPVSGLTDEVYIATVRSSSCTGGFTVGQSFVGSGAPGQVLRLDAAGSSLGVFVDLSLSGDFGLIRGGLFQDRYCAFGGKLVVTTTDGNVWLVDSTGSPTLLASGVGPTLEGPTTVPVDPRYGPWSGAVLVTEEAYNVVASVDAAGNVRYWDFGYNAEGIHVIPANQDFYGVDFADGQIVRGQASQFASIVGDILLANENGVLQHIYWDAVNNAFVVEDIAAVGQFEGSTFAPLTVRPDSHLSSQDPLPPTVQGSSVTYSATLTDGNGTPIPGEAVTITLGTGPGAQSCVGITNGAGVATCTINPVTVALGAQLVTDSFAGVTFVQHTRVVELTPPKAQCIETTNPSGKNVPTSGPNAGKSGQNPDGFYQLFGTDNVAVASIVVKDTGSSFVSNPFASGDKVKITQAPGATPSDTRPGPGVIVSQLKLKGDALLVVTDTSGNVATALCKVPPRPK